MLTCPTHQRHCHADAAVAAAVAVADAVAVAMLQVQLQSLCPGMPAHGHDLQLVAKLQVLAVARPADMLQVHAAVADMADAGAAIAVKLL